MKQRKNQSAVKAVSQKHASNDASFDFWVFSASAIPMISGFNNNDNNSTCGFILRSLSVNQTKMIVLKTLDYYYYYYYLINKSLVAN